MKHTTNEFDAEPGETHNKKYQITTSVVHSKYRHLLRTKTRFHQILLIHISKSLAIPINRMNRVIPGGLVQEQPSNEITRTTINSQINCGSSCSMPTLLLTNANHLMNKLDELHILTSSHMPDIIAITESWLSEAVPDNAVSLNNYVVFRKDRINKQGGGVVLYVRDNILCSLLPGVNDSDFEIIWVKLRPKFLPRPFAVLVVIVVYCPPWYNIELSKRLASVIIQSYDIVIRKYPNAAFILCGDFNNFNIALFNRHLRLHQVNSNATRGENSLDRIYMNCNRYYCLTADILPPLGRSDHNTVCF